MKMNVLKNLYTLMQVYIMFCKTKLIPHIYNHNVYVDEVVLRSLKMQAFIAWKYAKRGYRIKTKKTKKELKKPDKKNTKNKMCN